MQGSRIFGDHGTSVGIAHPFYWMIILIIFEAKFLCRNNRVQNYIYIDLHVPAYAVILQQYPLLRIIENIILKCEIMLNIIGVQLVAFE